MIPRCLMVSLLIGLALIVEVRPASLRAQESPTAPAVGDETPQRETLETPAPVPTYEWRDVDGDGRRDAIAVLPDGSRRVYRSRGDGGFDEESVVGLELLSEARLALWEQRRCAVKPAAKNVFLDSTRSADTRDCGIKHSLVRSNAPEWFGRTRKRHLG